MPLVAIYFPNVVRTIGVDDPAVTVLLTIEPVSLVQLSVFRNKLSTFAMFHMLQILAKGLLDLAVVHSAGLSLHVDDLLCIGLQVFWLMGAIVLIWVLAQYIALLPDLSWQLV